jgi:cardiolipin synthase
VTRRDIPNLITFFRFVLIIPVAISLLMGRMDVALILFAIAGFSDGVDGFLARQFDWRSKLGAILDPLADKGLMATTIIILGILGLIPWWLVGLMILRDVIILVGAVSYFRLNGQIEMDPSVLSKLNTLLQIILVIALLWNAGFSPLPDMFIQGLIILVTMSTVFSGVDYVFRWGRKALQSVNGS